MIPIDDNFHRLMEEDPEQILLAMVQQIWKIALVSSDEMTAMGQYSWATSEIETTTGLLNRFSIVGIMTQELSRIKSEEIYDKFGVVLTCTQQMGRKWIKAMEQVKVTRASKYVGQVLVAFSDLITWNQDQSPQENYRRLTEVSIEWNESLASGEMVAVLDDRLQALVDRAKAHPEDELMVELARKAVAAHDGAEQSIGLLELLTEIMDTYLRAFRVLREVQA